LPLARIRRRARGLARGVRSRQSSRLPRLHRAVLDRWAGRADGHNQVTALPLAGVTVVALEQAVAAPIATRHLADLGARVVKVERPDGGDFARRYDNVVGGLSSHFVWLNRGKESVTLDLKKAGGRRVLGDLLAGADVFVQNLAPGAADRLGLAADVLRARHPGLVTVDMSGYGSTGPYRNKRAYDMLVQCESGLASVTGPPERPAKAGIPASDIAAGMYALSATLAALVSRACTGAGSAIEISMFEATAEWMGYQLYYTQCAGQAPQRAGLSHPSVAPYDAYPTADYQEVLIGVQNDREWARFAAGFLERPELADDPGMGHERRAGAPSQGGRRARRRAYGHAGGRGDHQAAGCARRRVGSAQGRTGPADPPAARPPGPLANGAHAGRRSAGAVAAVHVRGRRTADRSRAGARRAHPRGAVRARLLTGSDQGAVRPRCGLTRPLGRSTNLRGRLSLPPCPALKVPRDRASAARSSGLPSAWSSSRGRPGSPPARSVSGGSASLPTRPPRSGRWPSRWT
jgi:crotonobetainyl-CoA:carnitine CoA-transferase CaiB-like acyl-CoA transferase